MLFLTALVAATLAGYFGASWPGFRPKHVRVVGNAVVPTHEILLRARIDPHRNIWLQNTAAMARRIESIPYVLRARLYRRPPAAVTIVVTERRPFALVRSGDAVALVDSSLRVLERDPVAGDSLPLLMLESRIDFVPGKYLRESSARALRDATLALRAHGVAASELRDQDGDVSARVGGGVRILLGDEANVGKAAPLVEPILTRLALLGRSAQTLDLRSPTTPVVTERRARASGPGRSP